LKSSIQVHHTSLHVLINRDNTPSCHKEVPVRQIRDAQQIPKEDRMEVVEC
jgi:hypothetical protein